MRLLVLLRHAKAVKSDPEGDHARALAEAGRAAAAIAGQRIAAYVPPDVLVVASDARRTRETAQGAFPSAGSRLHLQPALYGASRKQILSVIQALPSSASAAVIVGHNPGISETARALGGDGEPADLAAVADGLSTADAVVFTFDAEWDAIEFGTGRIKAVLARRDGDG